MNNDPAINVDDIGEGMSLDELDDIDKLLEGIDLVDENNLNSVTSNLTKNQGMPIPMIEEKLTITEVVNYNITYRPPIMYDRGVQTIPCEDEEIVVTEKIPEPAQASTTENTVQETATSNNVIAEKEAEKVFKSDEFNHFLNKATKTIQKSFGKGFNAFKLVDENIESIDNVVVGESPIIQPRVTLFPKGIENYRKVNKIEWSSSCPEMFLATYQHKKRKMDEYPDGLVMIWSSNYGASDNAKPDHILEFTNTVKAATFSKHNPFLVIGGASTGRIIVWDIRSPRRFPVSLSPYPASITTHSEIVAVKIVENHYYNSVYAVSTDNKVFKWKLNMLMSPEEVLVQGDYLTHGSILCADVIDTGIIRCALGTHSGNLLSATPVLEETCKPTILTSIGLPVTSVCFNEAAIDLGLSHIALCTGLDGSVRIWDLLKGSQLYVDNKFRSPQVDAKWSPSHPYLFCAADITGGMEIFNINDSFVRSVSQFKSKSFITALQWSANSSMVALGDDQGSIQLLNIDIDSLQMNKDGTSKFTQLISSLSAERTTEVGKENFDSLNLNFKNLDELLQF